MGGSPSILSHYHMGTTSSRKKMEGKAMLRTSSFRALDGIKIATRVSGATVFGSEADLSEREFNDGGDFNDGRSRLGSLLSSKQLLMHQMEEENMEEGKAGSDLKNVYDTEAKQISGKHHRLATNSFRNVQQIEEQEELAPMTIQTLPISLLDGTTWALRYSLETDKFRHAMLRLQQTHGLESDGAYSFFSLFDGLLNGEIMPVDDAGLIRDEVQHWEGADQRSDYLFKGSDRLGSRSKHVVLRRRVYFSQSPETREALLATSVSSMAHTLAFIDASYQFRRGWYHQNREQLVEASALLYHALHIHSETDAFSTDMCIDDVLPPICVKTTPDALTDLLQSIRLLWKSGIDNKLTALQVEQIFCHKLSKWNPWYGSIVFPVTECGVVGNLKYLAATEDSIYILIRDDTSHMRSIVMEKQKTWPAIKSWNLGETGNTIEINVTNNGESKNDDEVTTWSYDVKPGNGVTIVNQLIEYSHCAKK